MCNLHRSELAERAQQVKPHLGHEIEICNIYIQCIYIVCVTCPPGPVIALLMSAKNFFLIFITSCFKTQHSFWEV